MSLRLDLRALTLALRVARRLASDDQSPEGLSLIRELLASLVNSKQLLDVIKLWIELGSPSLVPGNIVELCQRLPRITKTLAISGYATEAVRVMATAAGLVPGLSGELVEAAGLAFSHPSSKAEPERVLVAATELTDVGMNLLTAGNSEGIILMGAAHRVAPSHRLPIEEIRANVHNLHGRRPVTLQLSDTQVLTNAAYDLHFSGRSESAVRVGTMVPSLLPEAASHQLFMRLERAAKPGTESAFHASYEILDKGYVSEAASLLLDSGAASASELWAGLDKEVIVPSQELKTPNRFNFYMRSGLSLVNPAPLSPPDSSFYFALEGADARCDQVLWGKVFDLVFHYDELSSDAFAVLKGRKLGNLLKKKMDLYIIVQTVTLTLTDDLPGGIAHFEDGKLTGKPPRFHLRAPEKGSGPPPENCGVAVAFFSDGALLYRFFLDIHPVDALDETATEGCKRMINLDLADFSGSTADKRDALLSITKQGGAWSIYYDIGGVQSPALVANLGPSDLANQYEQHGIIKDVTRIAGNTVWKLIDSKIEIPEDPELKTQVLECSRTLMTVGSKLYDIFSKDKAFKTVFELIEKLKDGSKITILTNDVAFPWELLYPLYYDLNDPKTNYEPGKFWGKRFQIEQLLYANTESEKLPEQRTQPGRFYVGMGLNESIDKDWEGYPLLPVKFQKDYCDKSLSGRGEHMEAQEQITRMLKESYSASLIYFFCHGDENHLKFEESKDPLEAHSLSPNTYPGWPLVFLNACSVGNISPLSFNSFRTRFREKKAAGLVAPSFPIPTLFAAVFGKAVLDEYAARRPIGQILFDLRGHLLDQDNALGLLYSLQCPLDVRAPEE